MKSMITQGRDTLIEGGLIKKSRSMNTSDKKDSGAHLARGEAKREGFNA
jgi:hypothetical protein